LKMVIVVNVANWLPELRLSVDVGKAGFCKPVSYTRTAILPEQPLKEAFSSFVGNQKDLGKSGGIEISLQKDARRGKVEEVTLKGP
jgi:hypothetical protein